MPVLPPADQCGKSSNWYAVHTRCRHEKVVHQALNQSQMESFLPLRNVVSQWKDRRKLVQKPLFPGYLFVKSCWSELYRVREIPGAVRVLGNGRGPIPVPDEQVLAIRRMLEGPDPVVAWPGLQKGKRVRVVVGPLTGLEAYIVERKKSGDCQLVVNVDLLGRSVAVEIAPHYVEPIL